MTATGWVGGDRSGDDDDNNATTLTTAKINLNVLLPVFMTKHSPTIANGG